MPARMIRMPASCRRFRGSVLLACLLMFASGCAYVTPRFPQNIQASFAREDMRKLTTRSLELYYPEPLRASALRVAARLEGCVERLRGDAWSQTPRDRALIYLTSADFNNAYVVPTLPSIPQQMVLPQHMSLELFNLFGLGETDIGDVACHEAVHYVQMQQVDGVWGFLNRVTGGVLQPNIFTESWFLEGLATYFEGRLGKDTGRPSSPIWRGWFESMVQETGGHLNPGYLSVEHRALEPFGGNYLTGMHFVEYLARTYGERKLWELIDVQGSSVVPPLAVTLRFKKVFGKDVGSLFSDYSRSLRDSLHVRERPDSQKVLVPGVGYFARLATHAGDGATAVVSEGRESIPQLAVYERDGQVRFERALVQLLPGRRWVQASATLVSGMSFSADGAWLFLVGSDLDNEGSSVSKLWKVDARTGDVVRLWGGLEGMGGAVTPDGLGYVFVRVQGDVANLVRLDLETGRQDALTDFTAHVAMGPPAISPDGQRMVFPMGSAAGWDLVLREADGALHWLTRDGQFNYSPKWLDAERVVFLREHERRLQAHVMTVATREVTRITDAPFLVMDVAPMGQDSVVFLNRDGTHFTVDHAPVTAIAETAPSASGSAVATALPATAAPGSATTAPASTEQNTTSPPAERTAPPAPEPLAATPPSAVTAQPQATSPILPERTEPPPVTVLTPPPLPGEPTSARGDAPAAADGVAVLPTGTTTPTSPPADAPQQTPAPEPLAPATSPVAVAALDEPVRAPPEADHILEVVSDNPYSPLEDFFIPDYRLPYLYTQPSEGKTNDARLLGGLALAGQDRLGFHAYALQLTFDTAQDEPGISLAYGNAQLAPFYIQLSASRIRTNDHVDTQATAFATRTFWTTPVTFGLLALRRQFDATNTEPALDTKLIGPEVAVSYFAGAGTAYGGTQRGLGVSLSGGLYPNAFFRTQTMGDVRVGLDGFLGGLPFTGKDNLQLTAVGRALPGAPAGLLEVGGILPGQVFYKNRRSTDEHPLPLDLQPGIAFGEYLRGFEDRTFRARNVAIASATYRYRFILDRGWASTLFILPSFFLRQFELEGFGSAARLDNRRSLGAVGGAATLRFTIGQFVPFAIYYQYAYRFQNNMGNEHLIGLLF
ncbi:hypothetical protein DRW03_07885 [Corallococcus sp. H22C18031201]|nr:hypothetical protein DRW03_07885 [Corallococcus sp. H22C18031201]